MREYGSECVTFSSPTEVKWNLSWEENGNSAGKKSQLFNGKSLLWQDLLGRVNWKQKFSCWHPEETGHSTLPQLKGSCLEPDRSQSRDSSPQGTFSRYLGNSLVSSICFSNFRWPQVSCWFQWIFVSVDICKLRRSLRTITLSFCSASRIRWSCQKWRQLSPLYEGTVKPQGTCLGRIGSVLSKLKTTLGTYLKNLLISMIWKTRYAVHDLSSSHAWKALETSSSLSHTYLVFVLQVRLCHLCPSQISLKLFYPNFGFLQN